MTKLDDYGFIASRPRGEYHSNNQQMAKLLHKAVGLGGKEAAPLVRQSWLLPALEGLSCQISKSCSLLVLAAISRA